MATAEWLAFGEPRSLLSGSRYFQYLPIESHIYKFQTEYYNAISGHVAGNSDAFIVFMLTMINRTLDEVLQQTACSASGMSEQVKAAAQCDGVRF